MDWKDNIGINFYFSLINGEIYKMINENTLLLLSIANIVVISMMIYKKKYTIAWVLSFIQAMLLLN